MEVRTVGSEDEATGPAGVVVVGCEDADVADGLAALAPFATGAPTVRSVGGQRSIISAPTVNVYPALKHVRNGGWAAAIGPASAGQAVGWQRRTAPMWFAADACVCLPWSDFDRDRVDTVVEIDPGGGFGAGTHPTTLLLLRELAARPLGRVLDVGSGSGVLAVAAAQLGAERVWGIDLDSRAVAATHANAARNHVADRVEASITPLREITGSFDVVLANIHAHVLHELAADLVRTVAPGGWMAISGISRAQESRLARALEPLTPVGRSELDDWVSLVLA